jgi:hypothetical protein
MTRLTPCWPYKLGQRINLPNEERGGVSGGLGTNPLSSCLIPKDQPNFFLPHLLRKEFGQLVDRLLAILVSVNSWTREIFSSPNES